MWLRWGEVREGDGEKLKHGRSGSRDMVLDKWRTDR